MMLVVQTYKQLDIYVFVISNTVQFIQTDFTLKSWEFQDFVITDTGRVFGVQKGEIKIREICLLKEKPKGILEYILPTAAVKQKSSEIPGSNNKSLAQKFKLIKHFIPRYSDIEQSSFSFDDTKGIIYQLVRYKKTRFMSTQKDEIEKVLVYEIGDGKSPFLYRAKIKQKDLSEDVRKFFQRTQYGIGFQEEQLKIESISAVSKNEGNNVDLRVFLRNGYQIGIAFDRKMNSKEVENAVSKNFYSKNPFTSRYFIVEAFSLMDYVSKFHVRSTEINPDTQLTNDHLSRYLSKNRERESKCFKYARSCSGVIFCTVSETLKTRNQNENQVLYFFANQREDSAVQIKPILIFNDDFPEIIIPRQTDEIRFLTHQLVTSLTANPNNSAIQVVKIQEKMIDDPQMKFSFQNSFFRQTYFQPMEIYALSGNRSKLFTVLRPVDRIFTIILFFEILDSRNFKISLELVNKMVSIYGNINETDSTFENVHISFCSGVLQIFNQKSTKYHISIPMLIELCESDNNNKFLVHKFLNENLQIKIPLTEQDSENSASFQFGQVEGIVNGIVQVSENKFSIKSICGSLLESMKTIEDKSKKYSILVRACMEYFVRIIRPIFNESVFYLEKNADRISGVKFSEKEFTMILEKLSELTNFVKNFSGSSFKKVGLENVKIYSVLAQVFFRANHLLHFFLNISQSPMVFEVFLGTHREALLYKPFKSFLFGDYQIVELINQLLCEHLYEIDESRHQNFIQLFSDSIFWKQENKFYVDSVKTLLSKIRQEAEKNTKIENEVSIKSNFELQNMKNTYQNFSNASTNIDTFNQTHTMLRKTLCTLPDVRPSTTQVQFSIETNEFLRVIKSLSLTNLEVLLPYYVHTLNMADYFTILLGKMNALQYELKGLKPEDAEIIQNKIQDCRKFILNILFEFHFRFKNYSKFKQVLENSKEFLKDQNLISKSLELTIQKFLNKLFRTKEDGKFNSRDSNLHKISFYSREELESTFNNCLAVCLKIKDEKLLCGIFTFLLEQEMLLKCLNLDDFAGEILIANFNSLCNSVTHARKLSRYAIESEINNELKIEIFSKLADFQTEKGDTFELSEMIYFNEKNMQLLGDIKNYEYSDSLIVIQKNLKILKFCALVLTEWKVRNLIDYFTEDNTILDQTTNLDVNELQRKIINERKNLTNVLSICRQKDLLFSLYASHYIFEEMSINELELIQKEMLSSFWRDSENWPNNFIMLFGEFSLLENRFPKSPPISLVAELINSTVKNVKFRKIYNRFDEYLNIREKKLSQKNSAAFFNFNKIFAFKITWINDFFVKNGSSSYSEMFCIYDKILRRVDKKTIDLFWCWYTLLSVIELLHDFFDKAEEEFDYTDMDLSKNKNTLKESIRFFMEKKDEMSEWFDFVENVLTFFKLQNDEELTYNRLYCQWKDLKVRWERFFDNSAPNYNGSILHRL